MANHQSPVNAWMIGLSLALALGFGSARADLVVKKNGESIKGRIVRATRSEVQIEVGDILLRLPRSEVERIDYDNSDDAKLERRAAEVQRLAGDGRVFAKGEALEKLKDLAFVPGITDKSFAVAAALRVAEVAFKQLEVPSVRAADPAAILRKAGQLRAPALKPLWKAAYPGDRYNREFRRKLNRAEGNAMAQRGKAALEHLPSDLESAKKDLSRAAELLGPQQFLGGAYVDLGTFRWAVFWKLQTLKKQVEALPPKEGTRISGLSRKTIEDLFHEARVEDPGSGFPKVPLNAQLFDGLNYLENWYRANTKVFEATTPVAPTPPPMPEQIWTPPPAATAAPSRAPGP